MDDVYSLKLSRDFLELMYERQLSIQNDAVDTSVKRTYLDVFRDWFVAKLALEDELSEATDCIGGVYHGIGGRVDPLWFIASKGDHKKTWKLSDDDKRVLFEEMCQMFILFQSLMIAIDMKPADLVNYVIHRQAQLKRSLVFEHTNKDKGL